jgi:hypothetical protein
VINVLFEYKSVRKSLDEDDADDVEVNNVLSFSLTVLSDEYMVSSSSSSLSTS